LALRRRQASLDAVREDRGFATEDLARPSRNQRKTQVGFSHSGSIRKFTEKSKAFSRKKAQKAQKNTSKQKEKTILKDRQRRTIAKLDKNGPVNVFFCAFCTALLKNRTTSRGF
jgi:hypothetical protein